jgi:pilus assembly protein CpaC
MKHLSSLVRCLILTFGIAFVLPAMAHESVSVKVGYTHLMKIPGVERVAIGNGELAEVRAFEESEEVLLIGTTPGKTDLLIWVSGEDTPRNHPLTVTDSRARIQAEQLRAIIGELQGLKVEPLGNGDLLVSGRAIRMSDKALVLALAERYDEVIDEVQPPGVEVLPTINLNAKVLEVRRSGSKSLGVDWDSNIPGPQAAFLGDFATNDVFRPEFADGFELQTGGVRLPADLGSSNGFFGIATRITSMINLLSQDGVARLLAEPRLAVTSGSEARLVVGGEIPLTAIDGEGQLIVTFKDFGVILEIAPVSDGVDGLIATKVGVEVSSIDQSVTVNGVPGTVSRRTDTQVTLRSGESFVISGLLSNEDSAETTRVPGLGRLPLIGHLFKSRNGQSRETELIVVIQPTLVSALDPANQRRLENFQRLIDESADQVKFADMD